MVHIFAHATFGSESAYQSLQHTFLDNWAAGVMLLVMSLLVLARSSYWLLKSSRRAVMLVMSVALFLWGLFLFSLWSWAGWSLVVAGITLVSVQMVFDYDLAPQKIRMVKYRAKKEKL